MCNTQLIWICFLWNWQPFFEKKERFYGRPDEFNDVCHKLTLNGVSFAQNLSFFF